MVKPEWGTKRSCPKCGTRFYDLTKEDPVTCIECGEEWTPEPVLKTKQPIPFEEDTKKKTEADSDLADDDDLSDVDEEENRPDSDVDLGDDNEDMAVSKGKGDDEEPES
ncbi:MAG: TIGR02300 family protein [Pontixanthobacter sp.]